MHRLLAASIPRLDEPINRNEQSDSGKSVGEKNVFSLSLSLSRLPTDHFHASRRHTCTRLCTIFARVTFKLNIDAIPGAITVSACLQRREDNRRGVRQPRGFYFAASALVEGSRPESVPLKSRWKEIFFTRRPLKRRPRDTSATTRSRSGTAESESLSSARDPDYFAVARAIPLSRS